MVLSINGEVIQDAELKSEVERMRPSYNEHIKNEDPAKHEQQLVDWAKQNVVERTLLRQEALKSDIKVDEDLLEDETQKILDSLDQKVDENEVREFARQQLLITDFLDTIVAELPEVSQEKCKEFYEQRKNEFVAPESVHASHILKMVNENMTDEQAKEAIEKIIADIKEGADFGALANEHSDSPEPNGDLGYFLRNQMVPEFEKAAFETTPGELSEPVRSSFGYHVIKVHDYKDSGIVPFETIEPQIKNFLDDRERQAKIESYIDTLREKAEIIDN